MLLVQDRNWRLRSCEIRVLTIKLPSLLDIRNLLHSLTNISSCLSRCSSLISLILLLLLLSITLLRHLHSNFFNLVGH